MIRRAGSTLIFSAGLTLALVAGGRTQEWPLVTAELHAKASQQGAVRVLVQLDAPFLPEPGQLTPEHADAQRREIAAAQSLVRSSLSGITHHVIREFDGSVPAMTLSVGADGLRMLESLRGVVTRVVEDRLGVSSSSRAVPGSRPVKRLPSGTTAQARSSSSWTVARAARHAVLGDQRGVGVGGPGECGAEQRGEVQPGVGRAEHDGGRGALYTLSRQPGTVLAENYVFDIVRHPWLGGYGINGIFMHEGSNLITVRDNVFQNIEIRTSASTTTGRATR